VTIEDRRNWLAGLLVGVAGGILFWIFPTLAVLLGAFFVIVAATRPGRLPPLAGIALGVGATALVVLARAVASCSRVDAAPGQECVQPDLTPWFAASAVVFVTGAIGTVAAWRGR
jgi:hypothetical protein